MLPCKPAAVSHYKRHRQGNSIQLNSLQQHDKHPQLYQHHCNIARVKSQITRNTPPCVCTTTHTCLCAYTYVRPPNSALYSHCILGSQART